jgi:signal peptidase I
MDPTFEHGQYLIVDQVTYRFNEPKRGDVIVFRYPNDTRQFFIKRVIGLPGETIKITDNSIIIYNESHPKGLTLKEPYIKNKTSHQNGGIQTTELKNSEYFVLGDNRLQSSDSRSWGTLKRNLIIGRPLIRLLPPSSLSFFPGL